MRVKTERKFCLPLGEQNFLVRTKNTWMYFLFLNLFDCDVMVGIDTNVSGNIEASLGNFTRTKVA